MTCAELAAQAEQTTDRFFHICVHTDPSYKPTKTTYGYVTTSWRRSC